MPRLPASRCTECGATVVPPAPSCAACGSEDVAALTVPGRGMLYACTDVRIGKDGEPYRIGYVDLDPQTRVFARFERGDGDGVRPGEPAHAVSPVGDGDPTWLWRTG